jgi:hypothetical protein
MCLKSAPGTNCIQSTLVCSTAPLGSTLWEVTIHRKRGPQKLYQILWMWTWLPKLQQAVSSILYLGLQEHITIHCWPECSSKTARQPERLKNKLIGGVGEVQEESTKTYCFQKLLNSPIFSRYIQWYGVSSLKIFQKILKYLLKSICLCLGCYNQMGFLKITEIYFSPFWSPGNPKFGVWEGPALLVHERLSSGCCPT